MLYALSSIESEQQGRREETRKNRKANKSKNIHLSLLISLEKESIRPNISSKIDGMLSRYLRDY